MSTRPNNKAVTSRVYLPVTFKVLGGPDSPTRFGSNNDYPNLNTTKPKVDKATQKLIEQAEQANVYYNKGLDDYELKQLEAAKANFDKALNIKPDHVPALQNRGIVKYKLKDVAGACADWQRIVQLGQPLPETLADLCK